MISRPITMRISCQRFTSRIRRSTWSAPMLTSSATTPARMRTAGQKKLRYRVCTFFLGSGAAEDEPHSDRDQDDRPEDVAAQPPQDPEVVEQEIDADDDQDARPEVRMAPDVVHLRVSLERGDDLEEARPLLASCLDEVRSSDRRLHRGRAHQVRGGHAPQVAGRDLEQTLLEPLARLAREAGGAVGRLSPSLAVRRLQRVDVAARAEDRLLERLGLDLLLRDPSH